ncbi:MAG: hypothetical protein ACK551_05455 [Vampirovibrionales bacterium]
MRFPQMPLLPSLKSLFSPPPEVLEFHNVMKEANRLLHTMENSSTLGLPTSIFSTKIVPTDSATYDKLQRLAIRINTLLSRRNSGLSPEQRQDLLRYQMAITSALQQPKT